MWLTIPRKAAHYDLPIVELQIVNDDNVIVDCLV